jgi:hypothetical protein
VITVGNVPGYLVHPPNANGPTDPADVFAIAYDTTIVPMAPSGMQVTDVVSRKSHGDAGSFDVHFADAGAAGIEPRSGGPNGEHSIIFTFSAPLLEVASASVDCGSISSSGIGPGSNQYTVNLSGENSCNGSYVGITLQDVLASDGTASSTVLSPPIGLLLGDVNGSGRVDAADVSSVRQQTLQTITSLNFRNDVNTSGRIDAADVSVVRQQTLTSLP